MTMIGLQRQSKLIIFYILVKDYHITPTATFTAVVNYWVHLQTKYAQAAGVDSILTLPEVFYKPDTVEELVEFIDDVGEAAPNLPVLYYDIPNTTDVFCK